MDALVRSSIEFNYELYDIFIEILFNARLYYIFLSNFPFLKQDEGCKIGEYVCSNRQCIEHNKTCNLINDCGDWSDEIGCKGNF